MSIQYSPLESSVLKLLKTNKSLSVRQLADLYYCGEHLRPRHAEIVIGNVLRSLMKATAANNEKFAIKRTKTRGNEGAVFGITTRGVKPWKKHDAA